MDVDGLVRELGLPADAERREEVASSPRGFEALLDAGATATGDALFALHLPSAMAPGALNVAELAVRASPTVREAFERTARYSALFYAHLGYVCESDATELRMRHRSSGPQAARFALASLLFHARKLTAEPLAPLRVWFARPEPPPEHVRAIRTFFGTDEVSFGRADDGLAFDALAVDRPSAADDPRLLASAERWADRALSEAAPDDDVAAAVRRVLRATDGVVYGAVVARRLGLSARTLQRRLEAEGTTFTRVCDDVRRERVTRLLRDTELPLVEIASRTGFADAASLTRAFRRWTGATPGTWRRERRAVTDPG